jgi:hypothetical protein
MQPSLPKPGTPNTQIFSEVSAQLSYSGGHFSLTHINGLTLVNTNTGSHALSNWGPPETCVFPMFLLCSPSKSQKQRLGLSEHGVYILQVDIFMGIVIMIHFFPRHFQKKQYAFQHFHDIIIFSHFFPSHTIYMPMLYFFYHRITP